MIDKKEKKFLKQILEADITLVKLEQFAKKIFQWFSNIFLKANAEKCHILLSPEEFLPINLENEKIENVESKKLLGPTPDDKTVFYTDLPNICNHLTKELLLFQRN